MKEPLQSVVDDDEGGALGPPRARSWLRGMVRGLRPGTIRRRMVAMAMLITVVVLIVAMATILIHDLRVYQSTWTESVAAEAGVVAMATAPALAFDDRQAAMKNLAAAADRDAILAVAIFRGDGTIFASRAAEGHDIPGTLRQAMTSRQGASTIRGDTVEITRGIWNGDEFLGTLYMRARYDIAGRISAYLGIFGFISAFGLSLALFLSARLQHAILGPLDQMADVARQIVDRPDYALRLTSPRDEEIAIVAMAFNRMLAEIEGRTRALEQSNLALADSNQALTDEVTARRATEAALARANARLESTMAAAEIGSWVWNSQTGDFDADRNVAALYGIPDPKLFRTDPELCHRGIHEHDRDRVTKAESDALVSGTLTSSEYRVVRPDGSVRWVVSRGKRTHDAEGNATLLVGLLIDVTQQKLAEEKRRESERVFRTIGESINYGVWLTDAEGRNTYASDSFLRLTGMTQAQCSEHGWTRVLHPDEIEATTAAWQSCVRSGEPWYREHRIRDVDGNYHPVLAQGLPIRREDGTITAWAGINLDISRIKRTEEALREADRRKDAFLATLAHELRNPLAPIRTAADLLQQPRTTGDKRRWAYELIARQVRNMALLLDDLLDISRVTHGRLDIKPQPVTLEALISSATETARPLIEAKQHRLEIDLPPDPVHLMVDPLRISQAISNLLTNAAKYTDAQGLIRVVASVSAGAVRIAVSDSGIGLAPHVLPTIFEMFSQVEGSNRRSEGGLGIGLALVKGLITLHGGSVEAQSPGIGRGSTFTLVLPAGAVQEPAAEARTSPAGSAAGARRRVLIADDNQDAADSLALVLQEEGHETWVAYNGNEAVRQALQLKPEVLILDIGMPDKDGYDVARLVRKTHWGPESLLIALTGWGQREDVSKALDAGFDAHFRKPVDLKVLSARLGGARVQPLHT